MSDHPESWKFGYPEIISRQEAKARGMVRYFTSNACNHGHVCERLVCNRQCLKCKADRNRKRDRRRPITVRVKRVPQSKKEKRRKYLIRLKNDPERYERWKERMRQNHSLHRAKQRAALRALTELGIEI